MTTYGSSEAFYACLKPTFAAIQLYAPEALRGLSTARLTVRLKCSSPAAEVTLDGRKSPVQVSYGPGTVRADLEAALTADTLHLLLLDKLSTKKAMGAGQIRVRGPVWKLAVLIDVIKAGRKFYPDIVEKQPG